MILTELTCEVCGLELLLEGTTTCPLGKWPPTKSLSERIPPIPRRLSTSPANRRRTSTSTAVRTRARPVLS